jgi:hypothetical protein
MSKTKNRDVVVFLNGGLGNQLFQLHAALHIAGKGKVHVDSRFLKNVGLQDGKPIVIQCNLPENIIFLDPQEPNKKQIKIHNLMLRFSAKRRKNWLVNFFKFTINALLKINNFGLICLPRGVFVTGNGVGYSESLNFKFPIKGTPILIGYFQSFLYTNSCNQFRQDTDNRSSCCFFDLTKTAQKPSSEVLIHLRYGDYQVDRLFRVIDSKFLNQAIKKIENDSNQQLFFKIVTDEVEHAKEVLKEIPEHDFEILDFPDFSPVELLVEMSKFQTILISNSTFSWWAAFINGSATRVYYPSPWFRNSQNPKHLTPDAWVAIPVRG